MYFRDYEKQCEALTGKPCSPEYVHGYADAIEEESCDPTAYRENEQPDYMRGYADGLRQVNQQEQQ